MNELIRFVGIVGIVLFVFMYIVIGVVWFFGGGRTAAPVVVLPNDLSVMSKYEGDPSLLSGYVRNDSIILNFEGY